MEFPLLVDMAIHHVDLIRMVSGRNVERVTALGFRPAWSWYRHEPGLKMLLELEGGLPFSYSGDWSARGRSTSIAATASRRHASGTDFVPSRGVCGAPPARAKTLPRAPLARLHLLPRGWSLLALPPSPHQSYQASLHLQVKLPHENTLQALSVELPSRSASCCHRRHLC